MSAALDVTAVLLGAGGADHASFLPRYVGDGWPNRLVVQWVAFHGFLGRTARRWLPLTVGLGLYFGAADAIGIASGVWRIGDATTIGVRLLGVLPVEEALFFLLTTLMVAQTTMLFLWRFGDVAGEPWRG